MSQLNDSGAMVLLVGLKCGVVCDQLRIEHRSLGYVPPSERLAACYRAADVFVVPSRQKRLDS